MSIRWRVLFCVAHVYLHRCVHIYGYIHMSCLVQKHVGHILHPAVAGIVLMAMALFLRLMAVQAPLLRTGTISHNLQPSLDVSNMCPGWISLNAEWKRVGRCSKRLQTNPRTVCCKWPTLFRSPCDYHGQHDAWFGHVCAVCDCLEHHFHEIVWCVEWFEVWFERYPVCTTDSKGEQMDNLASRTGLIQVIVGKWLPLF